MPPTALPGPPRYGLAPKVQRPVHARKSRQYQRTSAHALPPSGTNRAVGKRIPHIQQRSWVRSGCLGPAMPVHLRATSRGPGERMRGRGQRSGAAGSTTVASVLHAGRSPVSALSPCEVQTAASRASLRRLLGSARVSGLRLGSGKRMEPRDVVVVGGSAGSLGPLRALTAALPPGWSHQQVRHEKCREVATPNVGRDTSGVVLPGSPGQGAFINVWLGRARSYCR